MKRLSLRDAMKILEDMKVKIKIPKAAETQIKRNEALELAIEALNKRKTAKWLYDKYYLVHVCSECDQQALEEYTVNPRTLDRDYDEVLSEYCPHCGKRMLEIEGEEDEW